MDSALLLRGALRALNGRYPVRVFVGILFGLALDGLRSFAVDYYLYTEIASGLNAISLSSEIAFGLLMSFCTFALPGRRIIPEEVIAYFNIIDEVASRTNMSQHQKFLQYQGALNTLGKKYLPSGRPDVGDLLSGKPDGAAL